ncbi:hypothetical protein TNCV_348871 [Trichonephila clavipes]|nr:hypothetical protein TNCV_348871 [Trichonephila clavipes]
MQHVVYDALAVEVQCIASPIARTFLSGLFLLGQMKSLVYETPVNSAEELVARISAATGKYETLQKRYRMFGAP